jgi:hypothetical protein
MDAAPLITSDLPAMPDFPVQLLMQRSVAPGDLFALQSVEAMPDNAFKFILFFGNPIFSARPAISRLHMTASA